MSKSPKANRWNWRHSAAAAVLAVVVYFLAAGPILWMDLHHLTPKWFQDLPIYTPLQWTLDRGPDPMRRLIQWYLRYWGI
jgi:hypothetical protein